MNQDHVKRLLSLLGVSTAEDHQADIDHARRMTRRRAECELTYLSACAKIELLTYWSHEIRLFMYHDNYHVRQRAWHILGRPLPQIANAADADDTDRAAREATQLEADKLFFECLAPNHLKTLEAKLKLPENLVYFLKRCVWKTKDEEEKRAAAAAEKKVA